MTYMLGLEGEKKKDLDKFDIEKRVGNEKRQKNWRMHDTSAWLRNEGAQNLEYEVMSV